MPFCILYLALQRQSVTSAITLLSAITAHFPPAAALLNTMMKQDAASPRTQRAARNFIKAPDFGLPYHMRGCEFTKEESLDRTLQMKIRRLTDKMRPPPAQQPAATEPPQLSKPSEGATTVGAAAALAPSADTVAPGRAAAAIAALNAETAAPPKKIRKTSAQAQQERINKKARDAISSKACKMASRLFHQELDKKERGEPSKSIHDVIADVRIEFGIAPSESSIRKDIREDRVGNSPQKRGVKSKLDPLDYGLIADAFVTWLRINQINADSQMNKRIEFATRIAKVLGNESPNHSLLDKILRDTAIDVLSAKSQTCEQRRVLWNTFENLNQWFNTWSETLLELGFAYRDNTTGEIMIKPEQLKNIVNIDETCLSLDGNEGQRGGRPSVFFFDPSLPMVGRGTSKTTQTSTMITGSNAAGEAIPPHFQFPTKAQSEATEAINIECLRNVHTVRAKFGCSEERDWPATWAMNAKGGMDDNEFFEFIKNSIFPLYPFARDKPGHRVILKVDSGLGRNFVELLAECRVHGFYIYPGVY